MIANLTRPRLMAGLLCLLIALAAAILLAIGRFTPQMMRASDDLRSFDVAQEPGAGSEMAGATTSDHAGAPGSTVIAVTVPRIAYTYAYSFRLDTARIAPVQEDHLALCRRLGPAFCRVTAMRRGGGAESEANANLTLQVSAALAETFGRGLIAAASAGGGETADRSISAEDLSRDMIDSAARIRTREVLIQRLTALLQTRSGNIEQAVAAERAINGAQEELEAARGALADMSGRVAMSAIEIHYVARGAAPAAANPIAAAFEQVGATAVSSLGAMILIVGIALPWALVGIALFLVIRVIRRRRDGREE